MNGPHKPPRVVDLEAAPPEIVAFLRRKKERPVVSISTANISDDKKLKRASAYLARVPPAIEGQGGSDQTFKAAQHMVIGFDLSEADAFALLWNEYNPRCVDHWDEDGLRRKVAEAATKSHLPRGYLLTERTAETMAQPAASWGALAHEAHNTPIAIASNSVDFDRSDLRNARRLVELHGESIRYVSAWGKWLTWTGNRWDIDTELSVQEFARGVSDELFNAALGMPKETKAEAEAASKAMKFALRSRNSNAITAMISLARADVRLSHDELDRELWLLPVENGTIDLRSGELIESKREHYSTKCAGVAYDAAATCPTWEALLWRIFGGDVELIGAIQRAVGYSLTGDVGEQCLLFLQGSGRNGKSTFVKTLKRLLGDFGTNAPRGMLELKGQDSHPAELAGLHGRRMVICQETTQGKRWDESLVKVITGGDGITARRMREDFWEFEPRHKLWVVGNHRPTIIGTDDGIWRRIKLVPFEVQIPAEEVDAHLDDKLVAEVAGILNWAIIGCLNWRERGLDFPEKVANATNAYREEQDLFGQFIQEACFMEAGASIASKQIRQVYEEYCNETGAQAMGARAFAERLRGIGAVNGIAKFGGAVPVRCWTGIRLRREIDAR